MTKEPFVLTFYQLPIEEIYITQSQTITNITPFNDLYLRFQLLGLSLVPHKTHPAYVKLVQNKTYQLVFSTVPNKTCFCVTGYNIVQQMNETRLITFCVTFSTSKFQKEYDLLRKTQRHEKYAGWTDSHK